MGYTTTFEGVLKFDCPMTAPMLAKVNKYFGMDGRDIYGKDAEFTYIDLEMTPDFEGVQWDDGTEKNRGMTEAVNYIITDMRETYPQFGLFGKLTAQGESVDDKWELIATGVAAHEVKIEPKGKKVCCPDCGHEWRQE